MIKKILTLFLAALLSFSSAIAATDKYSKEYLQSKNHFSLTKKLAECVAQRAIKKSLKKELGSNIDVKLEAYTASSLKKGIFKNLEITGEEIFINDIPVERLYLNSLTDYNYIDYTKDPVEFKSDMTFAYELLLTDEAINASLNNSKYQSIVKSINRIASSLFVVKGVRTKIVDNKLYIIMDYNLPIVKLTKDKSFITSTEFEVVNGKIKAKNVHIDTAYGNLGLNKVANLINLLNPLEFTLDMIDNNEYKGNVENITFVDNMIKVNGTIGVTGKLGESK